MELQRLDLFAPLGRPLGAETVRKEDPPLAVDTGPPKSGGPPLGVAGTQKEVAAIELKPQAKILDLLERILLADSNPPHDAFVQKGGLMAGTADRELAAKIGSLKLDAKAPDYSDILVALGVPVPAKFDATSVEHFKKAIADAFVSKTLPSAIADVVEFTRGIFGSRAVNEAPPAPNALTNDYEIIGHCIEGEGETGDVPQSEAATNGARPRFVPIPLSMPIAFDRNGARPNVAIDAAPPTGDYVPIMGPAIVENGDSRTVAWDRSAFFGERPHDTASLVVINGARATFTGQKLEKEVVDALRFSDVTIEGDRPEIYTAKPVTVDDRWRSQLQKVPTTGVTVVPTNEASSGRPVVFDVTAQPKVGPDSNVERPLPPTTKADPTGQRPRPDADVLAGLVTLESDSKDVSLEGTVKTREAEKNPRDLAIDVDSLDANAREPLTKGDAIAVVKETDVARAVRTAEPETKLDAKATEAVKAKVIEQVQEMAALRGNGRVTIRLNPEDLGTITLAVRSFGENIEVKATASNEGVRHVLHSQRSDLVQSVESRGLSLSNFTVGSEQHADPQHGQGKPGQDMRQDFARAHNVWNARHDEATASEAPRYGRYKLVGVDTLA
ncbi:MAG: flagellar hook-length control protein FliK [Fimbriimonadaceae bacterium]